MSKQPALNRRDWMGVAVPATGVMGGLFGGAGLLGGTALLADDKTSVVHSVMAASFKDGVYTLPPLPYAYDALEPHIDQETMKLHHDKHHQSYVDGINKTLKALGEVYAEKEPNPARLTGLQEDLSFHGSGHLLHCMFWATMTPKPADGSKTSVAAAIAKQFGSLEAFQAYFTKVAAGVKGSGWAILAYESLGKNLIVQQVKQHDLQTVSGALPLLPLDVWEHAYYLKYRNVRADYIKAWWNVVNWNAVDQTYQYVEKLHSGKD